ncbi:MAG: PP2C family protein-serine/threonine phosphatase [Acidobacteria bacterium]|nr:PP2C family protein-serine/threonine phosphatase [Acidobacteriota bacterium]
MKLATRLERWRRAFAEYTAGVEARQIPRVLGRDATRAFGVLTREQPDSKQQEKGIVRLWHQARALFLGLSAKLSPVRRILFLVALVALLFGLQHNQITFRVGEVRASAPLMLLFSWGCLLLLLVLELADRVLVRDELEVARQLQAELMPAEPPRLDGYRIVFSYSTANTIGGDYYDVVPLEDGRVLLAAGDASGHGIAAGIVMAVAHAMLKVASDRDPEPAAVASTINAALYRTGGPRAFMTLFCGLLEPRSGEMNYVCAGHPYPLLRRRTGEIEELGSGSLPLGLRPTLSLQTGSATLHAGDLLVMYSDGIPEQIDSAGRAFGFDRLRRVVGGGGEPQEVHDRVLSELKRFAGDERPCDDRSLVVISRD